MRQCGQSFRICCQSESAGRSENLQSEEFAVRMSLLFTVCKSVSLCLPTRGCAESPIKPFYFAPRVRLITVQREFLKKELACIVRYLINFWKFINITSQRA